MAAKPSRLIPSKITDSTYHVLRDIALREHTSVAEVVTRLIHHALECECREREERGAA